MRGSDPDAAVYWLARMLESGEDPRFIARRVIICASEDVGNADPQALVVAAAAVQACEFVGLPECQLALSQAVLYIAAAPKSNASTMAISKAREDVRSGRTLAVPMHLRDRSYKGAASGAMARATNIATTRPTHGSTRNICPKTGATTSPPIEDMRPSSRSGWKNFVAGAMKNSRKTSQKTLICPVSEARSLTASRGY